jgi:cysteine sulfinate desulfinase/cysteine desulfurase-like protein
MGVAPEVIDGAFRISICRDTTEDDLNVLYNVIEKELIPRAR